MNKQHDEMMARLMQTRTALDTVRRTMDSALDQVKVWHAHPEQVPTPAEIQEHKDTLFSAYGRYRVLQGEYDSLVNLTARLLNQHQSAKNAFEQGWAARLIDLLAQLQGEDLAPLREVLDHIAHQDDLPY